MTETTEWPVIEIDLSDFGPSPAEIMWRALDPELLRVKQCSPREPNPYTLKQIRKPNPWVSLDPKLRKQP